MIELDAMPEAELGVFSGDTILSGNNRRRPAILTDPVTLFLSNEIVAFPTRTRTSLSVSSRTVAPDGINRRICGGKHVQEVVLTGRARRRYLDATFRGRACVAAWGICVAAVAVQVLAIVQLHLRVARQ